MNDKQIDFFFFFYYSFVFGLDLTEMIRQFFGFALLVGLENSLSFCVSQQKYF